MKTYLKILLAIIIVLFVGVFLGSLFDNEKEVGLITNSLILNGVSKSSVSVNTSSVEVLPLNSAQRDWSVCNVSGITAFLNFGTTSAVANEGYSLFVGECVKMSDFRYPILSGIQAVVATSTTTTLSVISY